MPDADAVKAAAQTYIYGYPLVYSMHELAKVATGESILHTKLDLNEFGCARDLLDPDAKFVSPNNDTLYVVASCDVGDGPLVLQVPDTADRYYVLQLIDAWSNNFAYIGRRATGTAPGTYVLAPSGYRGPVPDGAPVIEVPTTLFVIVGRVQVNGAEDLPAVRALQDQFTLAPLGDATSGALAGVPAPAPKTRPDLLWWEQMRVALAAFPPPAADAEFVEAAATLGLTAQESPYVDPDPELAEVLVAAQQQGDELIEQLGQTAIEKVNGWTSALHAFDYNLDHLRLGTIDAPEWKIADRTTAYTLRAVAARLGLWGNHGYEADYMILWTDENDEPLDGSHSYELVLDPPPPVDAFWSFTMYDEPDYYLVANPINRYSIGDRTPGIETTADGAVTIIIQHDSPGKDREANWLPAPPGAFRPVMRAYQPGSSVLSGDYVLPKVRKVS